MTSVAVGMTIEELQRMKERAQPIVMVTAFDYPSGTLTLTEAVGLVAFHDARKQRPEPIIVGTQHSQSIGRVGEEVRRSGVRRGEN